VRLVGAASAPGALALRRCWRADAWRAGYWLRCCAAVSFASLVTVSHAVAAVSRCWRVNLRYTGAQLALVAVYALSACLLVLRLPLSKAPAGAGVKSGRAGVKALGAVLPGARRRLLAAGDPVVGLSLLVCRY
jgi:hypothetical protein